MRSKSGLGGCDLDATAATSSAGGNADAYVPLDDGLTFFAVLAAETFRCAGAEPCLDLLKYLSSSLLGYKNSKTALPLRFLRLLTERKTLLVWEPSLPPAGPPSSISLCSMAQIAMLPEALNPCILKCLVLGCLLMTSNEESKTHFSRSQGIGCSTLFN